jgi:hypothetical protein
LGWLFWNLMANPLSLVNKIQHRHRAGFETQRESPLRKRAKGEVYLRRMTVFVIAALSRPPPQKNWGRAGATGRNFILVDKEPEPRPGAKQYPESGLVKPPRLKLKQGLL